MAKLKPYTKYKDSGVDWLGEIPDDWDIKKIKQIYKIGRGRVIAKTELKKDGLYPVYSSQTKNNGKLGMINTYDYDYTQLTWTTDGANAGTVFLREGKYNCTNVCGTLSPKIKGINNRFNKYALEVATPFYKRPDTNGAKIMNNEMANIIVTQPPTITQSHISDYLKTREGEFDFFMKKLKGEIIFLNEYIQRVIHEAITKGIDSNGCIREVKPDDFQTTQIKWASQIPENWKVVRMKYIFRVKKQIANELGHNVLAITQKGIKIKNIESNVGQLASDYSKYQFVKKGEFAMNHMDLLTGYVDISQYDGVTSPDYRVFELIDKECDSKYLLYILQACYRERIFYPLGRGASKQGRWRLGIEAFNNFLLPIPTLREQKAIVDFLNTKTYDINIQINKINEQIQLVKEYKQSLISKVVTGKIDVRNINNNLSED